MDLTPQEFKRHLDMMASPDRWPRWPLLPVKRLRGGVMETGLMTAIKGRLYHVYVSNMLLLKSGPLGPQLDEMDREEYPDYEGILDAGWVVD